MFGGRDNACYLWEEAGDIRSGTRSGPIQGDQVKLTRDKNCGPGLSISDGVMPRCCEQRKAPNKPE